MLKAQLLRSLFRFLYHLLYHPLAWSYDLVAALVSGNRWKSWIYSCLPHISGPKVLEIGHGPGHLQVEMRKKGIFCVGIDASWQMSRIALRNTTHHHLNAMLINGYAQYSPFPDNTFDQVVATFPAEYISDPLALSQIHRILKPGGQLILLPGAWIHSKKIYDRFLGWLFRFSGLSPDWSDPISSLLRKVDFETTSLQENLGDSTVLLVIASKVS